ncbi:MAG: hypothetical protein RBT34_00295 [Anaerolineaceae bacterium]|nr:hypothetical protein [Anaerolineaceae bacterium]
MQYLIMYAVSETNTNKIGLLPICPRTTKIMCECVRWAGINPNIEGATPLNVEFNGPRLRGLIDTAKIVEKFTKFQYEQWIREGYILASLNEPLQDFYPIDNQTFSVLRAGGITWFVETKRDKYVMNVSPGINWTSLLEMSVVEQDNHYQRDPMSWREARLMLKEVNNPFINELTHNAPVQKLDVLIPALQYVMSAPEIAGRFTLVNRARLQATLQAAVDAQQSEESYA